MKIALYTFVILMFSGLSYGQDVNCPCPEFPKWQRLMDKGKYEQAYHLADDVSSYEADMQTADHYKFEREYGKTNCYRWYKVEAAYKWGQLSRISHYDTYHKQNEPKASYKFRFYIIEYGKQLLAKNYIDESLSEFEYAWQMSIESEMEKCSETDLENNQVMFQLAELLGDVYSIKQDYKNALKYYKFYDSNKYSAEINNKIALAKQNLDNKK